MNITFDNVSFKYLEKKILDNVSFSISLEDKIGIVGLNGVGKTTLLKLIMEEELPKGGKIIKSGKMKINYLEQEPIFDENKSLLEIVLENNKEETLEYEAKSILSKLGFNDSSITTKNMSGGQRKRVALARCLVCPCDFLILDEPTNHLDNELIVWLEKYLIKFKKGLLMVTHDRYFLQRVCNKMMELDFGKIYLYDANYDTFLDLKAKRILNEEKEKTHLKKILKQEQDWASRGVEARRTKNKARLERFNQMSKIEFNEKKDMAFESVKTRLGKKLIEIKHASKAFGDKVLFNDFTFDLQREDIIGIVGENGCGKTTLFKILMGEVTLDSGEVIKGETLRIGYFSQHLELIDKDILVIDYIKEVANKIETLDGVIDASSLLERFLFTKDLQYTKVKMLSGGEKRRLQLVRVLSQNPNLLLFDEPTNDLDLYTLEILEDYLMNFNGPILVVSHDRYFLDKICNKLLVFKDSKIIESLESFSEYLAKEDTIIKETKVVQKRNQNRLPASIRNEIERSEKRIAELEDLINNVKEELKTISTDYKKLMELEENKKELEDEYDSLMNRYFELLEIKESYSI